MNLQARFVPRLADFGREAWNALRPDRNPFLDYQFLHGLEQHACLQPRLGWRPHHLGLYAGDRLLAAAPVYLKNNSHGEFVFDQRWAEAYHRHGLDYYPKLLCAVPYSPVTGPRLLCGAQPREDLRQALLAALCSETARLGLSSAHVNFPPEPIADRDWLQRYDFQFIWHRRDWTDFGQFLAALSAKKRKNIQQERAQVERAGVRIRRLVGAQIEDADLDVMYAFYLDTFERKGNLPVLTPAFFRHLREQLGEQLLVCLAERDGRAIAGALFLFSDTHLYGRYWGASDPLPGLHFELCYYQGIEFCLQRGIDVFEPGAQGEHKIARGFLPTRTHSAHHVRDPRFRDAIAHSLVEEYRWLERYAAELQAHSPYREPQPSPC